MFSRLAGSGCLRFGLGSVYSFLCFPVIVQIRIQFVSFVEGLIELGLKN